MERGGAAPSSPIPRSAGEDHGEIGRVSGHEGGALLGRKAREVAAERVDDAVEDLVRHGFAGVTAARQDQGIARAAEPPREAMDQRGLSHAGRRNHGRGEGASGGDRGKGVEERLELGLSPGERAGWGLRLRPDVGRGTRPGGAAEAAHDLRTSRPVLGIPLEERHAQLVEVGRHRRCDCRGRRRELALLGGEDVLHAPGERRAPRQRPIEHASDGVPVARGERGLAGSLLGRHVRRRAFEASVEYGVDVLVAGQPEIEHDHAFHAHRRARWMASDRGAACRPGGARSRPRRAGRGRRGAGRSRALAAPAQRRQRTSPVLARGRRPSLS